MRVEISDLPKREFQRDYIDEFIAAKQAEKTYRIADREVVDAAYGHCQNYPRGFWVEFA